MKSPLGPRLAWAVITPGPSSGCYLTDPTPKPPSAALPLISDFREAPIAPTCVSITARGPPSGLLPGAGSAGHVPLGLTTARSAQTHCHMGF